MNFLSHYYFDHHRNDSHWILGTVLPDLLKNGQKEIHLHPGKVPGQFEGDPTSRSMLMGWNRHLEVDRHFHSSPFFLGEMAVLKSMILPVVNGSPVRPSFLAHIGVELVLDHLLITHGIIHLESFYKHLDQVDKEAIIRFLQKSHAADYRPFLHYFDRFKSSRYLFSYQQLENIAYALNRICMRLWAQPFTETQTRALADQLQLYTRTLSPHFLKIFQEIADSLGNNSKDNSL